MHRLSPVREYQSTQGSKNLRTPYLLGSQLSEVFDNCIAYEETTLRQYDMGHELNLKNNEGMCPGGSLLRDQARGPAGGDNAIPFGKWDGWQMSKNWCDRSVENVG